MSPITLPLKPRLTSTTPLAMLKWTKIKSGKQLQLWKTTAIVQNCGNQSNWAKLCKTITIARNNHNCAKPYLSGFTRTCEYVFTIHCIPNNTILYYTLYRSQQLCAHNSWPWSKGKTRLQNKPQTYFPSLTLKSLKPPSFWRFHELDSPLTGVGLIGYVKSKPLGPGQIISIDVLV